MTQRKKKRLNISWIAVVLPTKHTAIFNPFGGMSQIPHFIYASCEFSMWTLARVPEDMKIDLMSIWPLAQFPFKVQTGSEETNMANMIQNWECAAATQNKLCTRMIERNTIAFICQSQYVFERGTLFGIHSMK